MGTPDFVAPEALIPGIPLDGRADLYAIGVMLYQMLTGEIPRGMWTMPGMKLGTDPRFDAIIGKAMQTDREVRYQSAAELRRDLDTILTTPRAMTQPQPAAAPVQQTAQKPPSHGPKPPQGQKAADKPPSAPPPPKRANFGMIIGLGATAVLLIGGYVFLKPPAPSKKTTAATPAPVAPPKPTPQPPATPKPATKAPSPAVSPAKLNSTPAPVTVSSPLLTRPVIQTLDLLALTDPVLDRVSVPNLIGKNEWKREGGELVYQPDGKAGKLAVPVAFDCQDYEIEFKAKKHSGNDRIHVDVPLKNGRILPLILNGQGRKVLNEKAGQSWGPASGEVHVSIRVIDGPGASDRILIQRQNVKGNPLADWTGDLDTLGRTGEDHPGFPKQPVTSIYVVRDKYAVQAWKLRVFEGAAKVLRETVAKTAAAAPASALATAPAPKPVMPAPAPAPAVPVTPPPAADPVSLKLADLETKFQAAFDRDAGAAYKAQIAKLNTGYATALDRALAEAAKAGKLDDAVALREEKERMTGGKGLPPEDLDTLPEALKKLRSTWRGAESGYAKQRNALAAPLFDAYDKALDAFQTELTQQNKIDDALRVKTARDELTQRRASIAPAAVEAPAPTKATMPAPAASTAVEASSSWRKAAEWILGVGGEIRIRRNGGGEATLKDAKDLPGGRFDILSITIDPRNGKNAEITDDDFTRFNGLRDIETVRMAHLPSVTGSGFAAFVASADSMKNFAVYNAPLQPQHLGFITQFKNLRTLELNRIPSLPAESLTTIQVFKELTQLRLLGQMKLDDKALLALAGLTKLTDLTIPGTLITDEGLVALKGMKGLTSLELADVKGITGSGFVHLAGAKELLRLLLSHTAVDDAALAHLSGLTKLRDLALHQTAVTDAGIRHLALLKDLRVLEIATKGVTGATLNELSGCKELTRLFLYDRTNANHSAVNDAGLQAVAAAGFPKLEDFAYVQRQVTDAGLAHLSALKLRKLTTNTSPGIEGLRHLAEISTLESLELGRSNLTDEGLLILSKLKSLQQLTSFDARITDEGLKHLQTMTALKGVTLTETKFTQTGLDALLKARPGLKVTK
ncbi:hypothetical protein [Prosthecobacter sp.]|uniref:hypothetical protein n=1 Tax=Prosthecobacter sp. TaxID=1965333 RepID=UPI002ABCBB98|nr:hypothetical protein [Prosthecobacter sp.]MDZ4403750.1 hypothetical protein [Prosthecobacter sp.]